MTNEETVSGFLQTAYNDERLVALLAHAEDGKLSFWSCCCFAGIPSAVHALQGRLVDGDIHTRLKAGHIGNNWARNPLWVGMSAAFVSLAPTDEQRRAKLIPLILAEMDRREALKSQVGVLTEVLV